MLGQGDHDALVARFYASATGDAPWSATLAAVAGRFGVGSAVMQLSDERQRVLAVQTHGATPQYAADYYASDLFHRDPRTPRLLAVPKGSIYYDHMLWDVDAMGRNPYVRQVCELLGVDHQLGCSMGLPGGIQGFFALLPTAREGHPSEAAVEAWSRLAPHLEQACALGSLLETRAATQAALLEALAARADGVIVLARDAASTLVNDAARAILAAGDGLSMSLGGFACRRPPETRRLQALVRAALTRPGEPGAGPGGRMLVTRPSGRPPYIVSVMAAPPTERFLGGHGAAAILHIHDLAAQRLPSRETLRAVFGLTGREADFAVELVRCAALEPAAAQAGMALNTARNHLASIARKTGVSGQAALVQLLGRLP